MTDTPKKMNLKSQKKWLEYTNLPKYIEKTKTNKNTGTVRKNQDECRKFTAIKLYIYEYHYTNYIKSNSETFNKYQQKIKI